MSQVRDTDVWSAPGSPDQGRRYPADDIVDIASPSSVAPASADAVEPGEAETQRFDTASDDDVDVPLDVRFTDALSMLADGGHDYGRSPLDPEERDEIDPAAIDESSKDA